jgi:hypothetical protein
MKTFSLAAALALVACNAVPPQGNCVSDGGDFVSSISLTPGDQLPSRTQGGLLVPLHVNATIECLSGGAAASASTSNGTLDGLRSGVQDVVVLQPLGAGQSGEVQGSTTLLIPEYAAARITVTLDDASYYAYVSGSVDAGVSIYETTFTP